MAEYEQTNLIDEVSEEELTELGMAVVDGFELDWDSRSKWMENNQEWLDLVTQYMKTKNWPWPNAANIKYPLVAISAIQFQSRVTPLILNGGNIVRGRVTGFDNTGEKANRAVRIGKHMSWQLLEQMKEWQENMDRLLMVTPIIGTAFKKTFFDPVEGRNRSIYVSPDDLVINYHAPSVADAQRITHILYETMVSLEEKIRLEIYKGEKTTEKNEDEKELGSATPTRVSTLAGERDKRTGLNAPSREDTTKPRVYLEQCLRYDIDEDGYAEPVIVTVEYDTKKVVRIVAGYDAQGITATKDGEIARIVPTQYYTKFGFIPNPDSAIYDLGFGQLIGPLNVSINTLINQLQDAGTLNNLQGGFFGRGVKLPKGAFGLAPGEWKQLSTSVEDLSKSIFPLPTKEPSAVLFQLLGFLVDAGRQLASTTDIMVGENPGQNQPMHTTMAVIENGLNVFGAIYGRIHRALHEELRLLFKLNGRYLNQREYFTVLDAGKDQQMVIGQTDYSEEDADVYPYSDPNVVSATQKLIKLQALNTALELGTINREEYTNRLLDAAEIPNKEALVLPPPDPQPDPSIIIEQMRLEWEEKKWNAEQEIKRTTAQGEAAKDMAVAQLALAKAASEEVNRQMAPLKMQLDALLALADKGVETKKLSAPTAPEAAASTDMGQVGSEMATAGGETGSAAV